MNLRLDCLQIIKHHSSTVYSPPYVCRICPVSAAAPLQVPNPRQLVCLQLRSPVWSQPRSSSRLTCSALAQYSLTSRPKVRSPASHYTDAIKAHWAFTFSYMCAGILCVHSPHIYPVLRKLATMSHSPKRLLNFAKSVWKSWADGGSMWEQEVLIWNEWIQRWRESHDIWWGKMFRDWNTLLSSSFSSLPTTFISGLFSNSFQLSLLLLWNKTCLWGKIFLLAPLLVFLVSVYPSSFLFPLFLHSFPWFPLPWLYVTYYSNVLAPRWTLIVLFWICST